MIIDTDNYAASGITTKWFSGGEPHVDVPVISSKHVHIYAKLRNAADMMMFAAVCSAIHYRGVDVHAFIPYLPGARQDRVQPGFALTSEIYAAFIGDVVSSVTALDVHSREAEEIFSKRTELHLLPFDFMRELVTSKYDVVLAPDEGALARATEIAAVIGTPRVVSAVKKRDPHTQTPTIVDMHQIYDTGDNYERNLCHVLIADDICDGGRTFVQAIEFASKQPNHTGLRWGLYVSHGIFSYGFDSLVNKNGISNHQRFADIYTTDSFYRVNENTPANVHVIPLLPYYLQSLTPGT